MSDEEFGECWLIAGTIGVQAKKREQWERTVKGLDFERVKQFLEGWARKEAPSPKDVQDGIRSGRREAPKVDCSACHGSGGIPALVITSEGTRTEYGARCHCVAGSRMSALPTVDQLRPKGGQVITNPTLTQRRETGPVVVVEYM